MYNDEKINKGKFYKSKKPSKIDEMDADKTFILKKESYGT